MAYRGKFSPEHIAEIRAFVLAHPGVRLPQVKEAMGLKMSRKTLNYIVNNFHYYDPSYTPPKLQIGKLPRARTAHEVQARRKPSIECACLCPTCGFGFDRMDEALDCCKRVKEA